MRAPIAISLTAIAVLVGGASTARAGGFSIYEAGARATGLGCAFTATADDGSAMFYNTAGLSFQTGSLVDLNLIPVAPKIKHRGLVPAGEGEVTETVDQSFPVPGFGFTHNPGGDISFGLGVYAPFGLGVEWQDPTTWVGRFTSYDVDLQTIYVSPAVSFATGDRKLAFALGLDIAWQHIELNRYQGVQLGGGSQWTNAIDVNLSGSSDVNVTPTFGLMVRPSDRLSFGAMFHAEKDMEFSGGDGKLTNVAPDGLRANVDQTIAALGGTDYELSTQVGLPHILSLGVSYRLHRNARVEVNAVHWSWSNFATLPITFSPDPSGALSTVIPEHYEDVWQWRAGLEYDVNPAWRVLAGYVRDDSPQPKASMSPLLPDADRNDWSLGVQHRRGPWQFTASAMLVLNEERDNLVDGRPALFPEEAADRQEYAHKLREAGSYSSIATILAFGVGHRF